MRDRLPDGFVIKLSDSVRLEDFGHTLVGGAPKSIVYLKAITERMLEERRLVVSGKRSAAFADLLINLGMAHPVADDLPPVDPAQVTYVVPVRDRPSQLDRLLTSIGRDAIIIVVDDSSRDPSAHARVAKAHGARFISLPTNVGPGRARNAGLREVITPYVTFVDSDVVVESDIVTTLLRHFADPKVAMVLPRVLGLYEAHETNWIGRYENSRSSLDLGELPSLIHPRAVASWTPGTCLVARVAALGVGFAEDLRVGEDVDLGWRLGKQGWRVRYDPSVHVRHDHRTKFVAWIRRKAFYGSSSSALTTRHPYFVAPALLSPSNIGTIAALLAQRRWSLPVTVGLWAATAARNVVKLHRSEHPVRLGASLATEELALTYIQLMGLLLRHWWPVTVVGCVFSRRLRRVVGVFAIVDAVLARHWNHVDLDLLHYGLARRLDDLAFGAGAWLGALKERSLRTFLPDMRPKRGVKSDKSLATVVRPAR